MSRRGRAVSAAFHRIRAAVRSRMSTSESFRSYWSDHQSPAMIDQIGALPLPDPPFSSSSVWDLPWEGPSSSRLLRWATPCDPRSWPDLNLNPWPEWRDEPPLSPNVWVCGTDCPWCQAIARVSAPPHPDALAAATVESLAPVPTSELTQPRKKQSYAEWHAETTALLAEQEARRE